MVIGLVNTITLNKQMQSQESKTQKSKGKMTEQNEKKSV
jgi:hypothetical protein